MRLARLHWSLPVGATVSITSTTPAPPGAPSLDDLVTGAGFTGTPGAAVRALSLPDTVAARMRVLVVGLNPSIYAAERGVGFARPSNRFWKAAVAAGLVDRESERDPVATLRSHGVGMTDLCKRATVASSELSRREYALGAARVDRLVRWLRPRVVAFVGLEGWRSVIDPKAIAGLQPSAFGGRPAYVLPSTSGLNARTLIDDLVGHFGALAQLADQGWL